MDSYHLTVLKIEGVQEVSSSYLYVYLGQNILRVLTLEYFDINPIPVLKGTLRLVIEDSQSGEQIANLSFESSIFRRLGYHWLPLSLSEEKCLKEVPEEVGLPRILVDIQAHILSPVQELTEDSDTTEENKDFFSSFECDYSKNRKSSRGLEILEIDDNMKSEEILEFDQILEMKLQLHHLIQKQEELLEKLKTSESNFFQKCSENEELRIQLEEKEKISEIQNKKLEEMEKFLQDLQENFQKVTEKLKEKENEFVSQSINQPSLNMTFEHSITLKPFITSQVDLSEAQERLSRKLFEAECKINSFKLTTLEEIDVKVRKYLNFKKLEKFASVSQELTYNISNKKVIIFLKNDQLYCKFDGSVKKFDYFIKNHFLQDIAKYKHSKTPGSSQKYLPTYIEKSVPSTSHTFYSTSRPKSTEKKPSRPMTSSHRQAYSPINRLPRNN
jgi:hypothetical protein